MDLILTNLAGHYEAFPPFGQSDHNTVLAASMIREGRIKATRFIYSNAIFAPAVPEWHRLAQTT